MSDTTIRNQNITKDKVISLFEFIRELNKLKQKVALNLNEYPWKKLISDFPDDAENITVFYRDRLAEEETVTENTGSSILLSVKKPEFSKCPSPDGSWKR